MKTRYKNSTPRYTKKDMKLLAYMSKNESIPSIFLPKMNYDPNKFKEFLKEKKLLSALYHLYEMPLDKIPLIVNEPNKSGYLKFRARISK